MEPPAQHAPVSVLIADFQNDTSDPTLSRTLEPTLKLALEGAGFVGAYDRTIINRIGVPAPERLDERAAQEIAVKQGVGVVLAGSVSPRGAGYTVSVRATQPVTGELITSAEDVAADKNQVLAVATGLAATVREALGDETSDSAQRFAMETLTSSPLWKPSMSTRWDRKPCRTTETKRRGNSFKRPSRSIRTSAQRSQGWPLHRATSGSSRKLRSTPMRPSAISTA